MNIKVGMGNCISVIMQYHESKYTVHITMYVAVVITSYLYPLLNLCIQIYVLLTQFIFDCICYLKFSYLLYYQVTVRLVKLRDVRNKHTLIVQSPKTY